MVTASEFQNSDLFSSKDTEREVVNKQYDLGQNISIEPIIHNGWNHGFRIEAESGTFFLRKYRRGINHNVARSEAPLVDFLSKSGLPVPGVIRNTIGELVSFTEEGDPFFLQTFVEGLCISNPTELNLQQMTNGANTLARFHLFGQEYKQVIDNKIDIDVSEYSFSRKAASDTWESISALIREKQEMDGVDSQVLQVASMKLEEIDSINEVSVNEVLGRLPKSLIHGDFITRNLIFKGDIVAAIIDWEGVRYQQRVWDLVKAVCSFSRVQNTEIFNTPLDVEKAKRFISAYEEINSLTYEERDSMFLLAYLAALHPTYILRERYISHNMSVDQSFPRELSYWIWWRDNKEGIKRYIFGL